MIHLFTITCVPLTLTLISAEAARPAELTTSATSTALPETEATELALASPARASTSPVQERPPAARAGHTAATTTLVLQPGPVEGMDTQVDHDSPDMTYGDNVTCRIGNRDGASYPGGPYRPLLRFDLSALPSEARVITASLDLYTYNYDYVNNTFLFYRATSTWDEDATWNTQPSYDSSKVWASVLSSTPHRTYVKKEVDVTDLVITWHEGTYTNYGFYITGANENDWTRHWFLSSDTNETTQRPKLVIAYGTPRAYLPLVLQVYE